MSRLTFKIEVNNDGSLEVDFTGAPIELAAALVLAAKDKNIERALLMAVDHIRDEYRVKEYQKTIYKQLNFN